MDAPAHLLTRSPAQVNSRPSSIIGLIIVVIAYLALATLYSVIVPLGEGPDEPGHAAHAFFLAREGRLPVQRAELSQSDVPGEGHQPPLAYALASVAVRWLPPEERALDVVGNPRFVWAGGTQPNALVQGSSAYWPWRGSTLVWHAARLVSVGLGAVTVIFTYFVAGAVERRTTNNERRTQAARPSSMPLLAAALVAFNPQFLFTSALVTNDALLVALSAVLLWLVVPTGNQEPRTKNQEPGTGSFRPSSIVHRPSSVARPLAIGVTLGLALITKQNAVLLIPIALLGVVRRHDNETWRNVFQRSFMRLSSCHLVMVSAALIAGWWYARNLRLYGDLFGLGAFQAEFVTQPFAAGSAAAWLAALRQLHESFWARFGWMNVAAPLWVLLVYSAVEVVALTGLAKWLLEQWSIYQASSIKHRWSVVHRLSSIVLLPLLAFAWVVSFALAAGLVAWQGRLLFPALPAIAVLLAWGLTAWHPAEAEETRRRFPVLGSWFLGEHAGSPLVRPSSFVFRLVLIALFCIALWLPFGIIRPAYTNDALPEQTALAHRGTPADARFANKGEPGVELRGWQVAGDARPGSTLDLTLTWHALARQSRDWSVFIHLVDAQDTVISSVDAATKNEAFPMTLWRAGDWVRGNYALPLPPDLAPGTYTLRIGLFDQQGSGRRTGVFDPNGDLRGDALDLTQITFGQ